MKYISYLSFFIGVVLGIIITKFISFIFVKSSHLCSYEIHANRTEFPYHPQSTLKVKGLVFVGVMTANKYISSRAKSVYETWGQYVPGKIEFFTSEASDTNEDLPLIKLRGVTDSYPPQKKSFMMLKYMYDTNIDDFEFFLRADDDLYIRTERLEKFLKSLNSSKAYYIGQAGLGNDGEFGHLSLSSSENFCMGGPGVILSRFTLQRLGPNLENCFNSVKSTHEDVEVGRCVQKYVGIPCTWSYEMQNIFYHNYSGQDAFTRSLKQKEIHRAITMHPIKSPFHLRRVDSYIKSLIIKEKEYEVVQAIKELCKFSKTFDIAMPSFDDPQNGIFLDHIGLGVLEELQDNLTGEWHFISKNVYELGDLNPKHRPLSYQVESVNDVIREVMETIYRSSKERGRLIDFKELLYGYYTNNPLSSSNYILDMLLLYKKYRGRKMTVPVRRHVYIQVPYGSLQVKECPQSSFYETAEKNFIADFMNLLLKPGYLPLRKISRPDYGQMKQKKINFILPLSGRFMIFQRFLGDFKRVCLEAAEEVGLIVISFRPKLGENDTRDLVEASINKLQLKFPHTSMTHLKVDFPFSRALALEIGASHCSDNDLLFFVDVDITFSRDALERIRWHTIQGKQVYFPIVFSEYDPSLIRSPKMQLSDIVINDEFGYWRAFGYGIVSLYKSDLDAVGGLNTTIVGWGKEDIDLYEKVLKENELFIFRAPDPGLMHIYHQVECDESLKEDQREMCLGSKYNTFASPNTLFKLMNTLDHIPPPG